jgi:hypothetical protein
MSTHADTPAFKHAQVAGRGRALMATRAIRPGEEVLREKPAAFVFSSTTNADDCHQMLAQVRTARMSPVVTSSTIRVIWYWQAFCADGTRQDLAKIQEAYGGPCVFARAVPGL